MNSLILTITFGILFSRNRCIYYSEISAVNLKYYYFFNIDTHFCIIIRFKTCHFILFHHFQVIFPLMLISCATTQKCINFTCLWFVYWNRNSLIIIWHSALVWFQAKVSNNQSQRHVQKYTQNTLLQPFHCLWLPFVCILYDKLKQTFFLF